MFRIFLRLTFDSLRLGRLFPFVSDKLRNRETSKDLPPFLNRMWVKIFFDSEFITPRSDSESDEGMFGCTKMCLGNFRKNAMCLYKPDACYNTPEVVLELKSSCFY